MILIEVNRYTIMKLEEAIAKHNRIEAYTKHEYSVIINWVLDKYLMEDKKRKP